MKKTLSVIFIISIIVSLICSNNAAVAYAEKSAASGDIESGSENMKIIIEGGQHEIKAAPGEIVEVKIQLKDVKPAVSLKIELNIDEKLSVVMKKDESTDDDVPDVTFEMVDIQDGSYTASYNEEKRKLILNWIDDSYKLEDDTVFATVRLKVTNDTEAGSYLPITAYIDPEDVFDKKMNNIDFELITGGIEIIEGAPVTGEKIANLSTSSQFHNVEGSKFWSETTIEGDSGSYVYAAHICFSPEEFFFDDSIYQKDIGDVTVTCDGYSSYNGFGLPDTISNVVNTRRYQDVMGTCLEIVKLSVDNWNNYSEEWWETEKEGCVVLGYAQVIPPADKAYLFADSIVPGAAVDVKDTGTSPRYDGLSTSYVGWFNDKECTIPYDSSSSDGCYVQFKISSGKITFPTAAENYILNIGGRYERARLSVKENWYWVIGGESQEACDAKQVGEDIYVSFKIDSPSNERGDVNGDGSVNNKDVVSLFKYVSSGETAEDESVYDFNGDGVVNNKDVVALFKYVSAT